MVKIKKENESRRERFIRLAESRTQKILYALKILGNCSNPQNYKYYKEDIVNIFNEIERQTENTKNLFLTKLKRSVGRIEKFSLKTKNK